MYYYIYDSFVQNKDYARDLAAIETRLADFGISGNIGRLSLFRDASDLIEDEVRRGAKTIVAVGNDHTIRKILDSVVVARAVLAFIPLGTPNVIAKIFGIPNGVDACDVLAKRTIMTVDMGKVNGRYFLSRLRIPENNVKLVCEGSYMVSSELRSAIQIKNAGWVEESGVSEISDAQDGMLDAVIDAKERAHLFQKPVLKRTQIPIKKVLIENSGTAPMPAFIDEEEFAQPRFEVCVVKKRLRVVTGRDRLV